MFFYEQKKQRQLLAIQNRYNDDVGTAVANKAEQYKNQAADKAEELKKQAAKKANQAWDRAGDELKNGANQVGNQVSATTEKAKDSVLGGVYNVKDAVVHTAEYTKDQLVGAQSEAQRKVELAKAEAQRTAEQAKAEAQKTANLWWSWGSKKTDEVQKHAEGAGERAGRQFDRGVEQVQQSAEDLKRNAEKTTNLWFNWGSKKADEASQKASEIGDRVAEHLKNGGERLKGTIDDTVGSVKKGADEFGLWSKRRVDDAVSRGKLTEEELARLNKQGLSGWGETAAQLAQDEYDEVRGRK